MAISKSKGSTPSERQLAEIGERSFLGLWSYPNPFRDQGLLGKELCDLLAVCGKDVLLFSDKHCKFPNPDNLQLGWKRWYKRSIAKAADQLAGAERWIRAYPQRVYIDPECKQSLLARLPDPAKMRVHRIIVARGAEEQCRKTCGGSGSMILKPGVIGATDPFCVGQVPGLDGLVHILDEVTLVRLLGELDTITDFVSYLIKKRDLMATGRVQEVHGEENLLALYMTNLDSTGSHGFPPLAVDQKVVVPDGGWANLMVDPQYAAKKNADRVSYVWDQIITEFTKNAFAGTLVRDESLPGDVEFALRTMAKESRLSRRLLGGSFLEFGRAYETDLTAQRIISNNLSASQLAYVFMIVPRRDLSEGRYREYRKARLTSYCTVVGNRMRQFRQIVGIATEPRDSRTGSFDLVYMDNLQWTPEMEHNATVMQREFGYLRPGKLRTRNASCEEWPSPDVRAEGRRPRGRSNVPEQVGRNDPCPCGSGLKYKRCHGAT